MIRRWRVEPDYEQNTQDGTVLAVSQEALAVATMDAVTMMHRAGGMFTVISERYPTGMPGEMVTVAAVVEWRNRTDARPEAEKTTRQPVEVPEERPEESADLSAPESALDDPTQYKGGEPLDDIGDGIDPNALPEEDDTELEAVH